MNKKKKTKKEFTPDFEEAWKIFDVPVQCGECYTYYNPVQDPTCPQCGSEEWVGSR